jgi:hypothetical protein
MRKAFPYLLALILLVSLVSHAAAQKQLIVLKNQKVLLRLYPGDEFIFSLKGSKQVRKSYINNLFDTAVVAHRDVIPFHKIDRVYFKRSNLLNVVGGMLVVGGAGYFLIDQFNVVIVHGESANIDEGVAMSSAIMLGAGLPLMLTKRNHARIGGRYRILVVDRGSGFYMPDFRQNADESLTD